MSDGLIRFGGIVTWIYGGVDHNQARLIAQVFDDGALDYGNLTVPDFTSHGWR
jgi:hypothetical protein